MYEFKTNPYGHQKTALDKARGREFYAYLMEMGTGKTKVMIDEAGILFTEGEIDCVVILAPKGVCANWFGELDVHMGVEYDAVRWHSGGGNKTQQKELKRILGENKKLRVLVMNIEALSSGTKGKKYLEMFLQSGRCYMAIDESTTVKNPGSKRTKNVLAFGRLATYRRIATGSPVTRSPLDLYSQFEFMSPGLLGPRSYYAFRARYAVMQQKIFGGRKVQVVVGFRNIEELTRKIEADSYRVLKEECLDLPDKIYTRRDVEMTPEQERLYVQMRELAFTEFEGGFVSSQAAITTIMRLHQIVCGHLKDDNGDMHTVPEKRVDALMDAVEETSGDVIIWARYREDIRKISERLRSVYGENSVAEFHGGNTKTREDEAESFKNDSHCRFMVSNQQSGGYGNTWVNATTVIYYSNDYDLEKRMQSEDRAHRSGQTEHVTYVDLVCPGTVDERILKALRGKIDISETILGDDPRDWLL